jgi:prepilin-type processing-associated H-X9-DG protein
VVNRLADNYELSIPEPSTILLLGLDPSTFDNGVYQPYSVHGGKGLNFFFVDGHGEFLKVIGEDADNASPWWRTPPKATDWYPYNGGGWPPPYTSGLWGD